MVRQGAIDNPPKVPFVMGFECAGEVEAIGEAVEDLKVGGLRVQGKEVLCNVYNDDTK